MQRNRKTYGSVVGCLVVGSVVLAVGANAGELDPPAGPVSETMKTLQQVEPREPIANDPDGVSPIVIDEPGSYYLTEEIVGLTNEHGIEIVASDVTLDLNGFRLRGDGGVGAFDGVHVGPGSTNIVIRNGIIRDFPQAAIEALGADNIIIRDVIATNNGAGILAGDYAVVSGCIARFNSGAGVAAGSGSVMTECVAGGNIGDGLFISSGSLSRCSSQVNGGNGVENLKGVIAFTNSVGNKGDGFNSNEATTLFGNVAHQNGGTGIEASRSLISNNTSIDNAGPQIEDFATGTEVENHTP